MEYEWFDINIPSWEKYLVPLQGTLHALEIGSFEGRSAKWLLENVLTDSNSTLTCIDPFDTLKTYELPHYKINYYDTFKDAIKGHETKVIIEKGLSQEVLRDKKFKTIYDFAYIDGSHEADNTLEDMILVWRLLKPGGLMIVDDYSWTFDTNTTHYYKRTLLNPRPAMDAFISIFKPTVLDLDKQAVLQKWKSFTCVLATILQRMLELISQEPS